MARIIGHDRIVAALPSLDLTNAIEAGFVAYSDGRAIVPPVGELLFDAPRGDAHIKYGRIIGDDVYVIKIASGFYDNPKRGLPGNSGLMLVFSATTGILDTILLDEGHLTNVRTALAGAITAKWLAPTDVRRISVLGTGLQARMQAGAIAKVTGCWRVTVWGRRDDALEACRRDMIACGLEVTTTRDIAEATLPAQLIVTTTASETPLLAPEHVSPGTHIVAMGSDTETKNEIDPSLLGAVDVYVADSIAQCATRGELHHAIRAGTRDAGTVTELGAVIAGRHPGRTDDYQITLADLTGVAVQDIAIAKAVCRATGETK
jgi:ornithine cyclodeaminase